MLLQGNFTAPATILVTRKNDADGKPQDHLFFESGPAPQALIEKFAARETEAEERRSKPIAAAKASAAPADEGDANAT
jgi:hypothetical protein